MALQPFSSSSSALAPFGGSSFALDPFSNTWDMVSSDPVVRSLYSDPLVRHTLHNARKITRDISPILNADIIDLGDHYEVQADLPGVSKDCLNVSVDNGCVTIMGERKKSYQHDDVWGTHRSERSYGKVTRTLTLPFDCDASRSEAKFELGMLTLTFPKLVGAALPGKRLTIQ